ncbi:hypothetical protein HA402_008307 [Bradysia odoriphaga]|nr:hypothetical protein HA402_008307 [Bradysia odoriphaga]
MSTDIGAQWGLLGCGNNNNNNDPHQRSPSLTSLPPLPDLIPIRKGPSIKNANETGNNLQTTNTIVLQEHDSIGSNSTKSFCQTVEKVPWPREDSPIFVSESGSGESSKCADDEHFVVDDDVVDERNDEPVQFNDSQNETTIADKCVDAITAKSPSPLPYHSSTSELCQINGKVGSRDRKINAQESERTELCLPAIKTRTRRIRVHTEYFTFDRRVKQTKKRKNIKRKGISFHNNKASRGIYRKPNNQITCNESSELKTVSRINPIFLFVKQEDTRIVEVRCEDYDKRNRIRLTKTANGWRAIPRTDSSSSRISSLLPKVIVTKREREEADEAGQGLNRAKSENSDWRLNPFASKTWSFKLTKAEKSQESNDQNSDNSNSHKKKKKKKKKRKKERKLALGDALETPKQECIDQIADMTETTLTRTETPSLPTTLPPTSIFEATDTPQNQEDTTAPTLNTATPLKTLSLLAVAQLQYSNRSDECGETRKCVEKTAPSSLHFSTTTESALIHDKEMHLTNSDGHMNGVAGKIEKIERCSSPSDEDAENNILCPDSCIAPVFESYNSKSVCTVVHCIDSDSVHEHHFDNEEVGEYHDLIEDSLVERHCEDNHISGDEDVKHAICLSDDYNDEDDVLMESQPVVDIISRLSDSLTESPKCLSFNEAGEIEGLHESLFENAQTELNHTDGLHTFNRSALEELSMTLKDLEKRSTQHNKQQVPLTVVSPDSCQEELPKDLSFKKSCDVVQIRPISRDSDAMQSPQPSGLPAVPPSPDILLHQTNKNLNRPLFLELSSPSPKSCDQRNSNDKVFMDLTSPKPKSSEGRVQQKEPLDLGKHRKSASPTVSCSEEVKRYLSSSDIEPLAKRVKSEHSDKSSTSSDLLMNSKTSQLVELLASGKDPDPLTQLRLLVSNPEWKLPDPILVPKDRLNAVLASPAREIPLLLTTRPELRLPEAFAFPSILQDPDILVISFAQLESILQKQDDLLKSTKQAQRSDKKINVEKPLESPRSREKSQAKSLSNPIVPVGSLLANGLAGDIDAATMAAFNQMLWLPYLGQMGQLNPEVFKAMSGLSSPTMPDALTYSNQNRFSNFPVPTTPMNYGNPLEFAMWQEALAQANTANMQRVMKLSADRDVQKKSQENKPQLLQQARQIQNNQTYLQQHQQQQHLAAQQQHQQQQQQLHQQQNQQQKLNHMMNPMNQLAMSSFFPPNIPNLSNNNRFFGAGMHRPQMQMNNASQFSPGYGRHGAGNTESMNRSSQMCMQPPSLSKTNHSTNHSMAMSPTNSFFPPPMSNLPDYNHNSRSKMRKESQQQHHNQNIADTKPRVTCKSLTNLLQPDLVHDQFKHTNDGGLKMSNLMAMPSFDLTSPPVSTTSTTPTTPKLKVKPGLHLLDPLAMQRRLLNGDDGSEVGSTTNGIEEMMMPNTSLYHPLLNTQKSYTNSPWQWTTVTATGE